MQLQIEEETDNDSQNCQEECEEDEEIFVPGKIVQVQGDVILYKNELQIKVLSGDQLDDSVIDLFDYLSEIW